MVDAADDSLNRIRELVKQRIASGQTPEYENMSVKELKIKALEETHRLLANDQKASIASIIVSVFVL